MAKLFHNNFKWIRLQLILCFKDAAFYLSAAFVVLTLFLLKYAFNEVADGTTVLIYNDGSSYGQSVAEALTDAGYNGISFENADSKDELIHDVTTGKSACGIIFGKDFDTAVSLGNMDECVEFCQSGQSADGYLVKELVFPYILECFSDGIVSSYITENDPDVPEDVLDNISSENHALLSNSEVSIYSVKIVSNEDSGSPSAAGALAAGKSIKEAAQGIGNSSGRLLNIAYFLIFALSLTAIIPIKEGAEAYLTALAPSMRLIRIYSAVLVRSLIIAVILSLIFFPGNIISFILLALISSLYAVILNLVTQKDRVYAAILPALIVIALLFSPVLYDLTGIIPAFKVIEKLFPLWLFTA